MHKTAIVAHLRSESAAAELAKTLKAAVERVFPGAQLVGVQPIPRDLDPDKITIELVRGAPVTPSVRKAKPRRAEEQRGLFPDTEGGETRTISAVTATVVGTAPQAPHRPLNPSYGRRHMAAEKHRQLTPAVEAQGEALEKAVAAALGARDEAIDTLNEAVNNAIDDNWAEVDAAQEELAKAVQAYRAYCRAHELDDSDFADGEYLLFEQPEEWDLRDADRSAIAIDGSDPDEDEEAAES